MTFDEEIFLKFHDNLYYAVEFESNLELPIERLLEIADMRDRLWLPVTF